MTLDELVTAIRITSSDPVAFQLADLLAGWKDDKADATELERTVERFVGNAWIASPAEHAQIYSLWSKFRDEGINGIGGMTMNERLYRFSLFHRWDSAQTDADRKTIYAKLLANP
jgi:hypothetical protein